jgi:hypothetical protein
MLQIPFFPATNVLNSFVGLANTRLEVYRWAAEHLADDDLREIFVALLQQAKDFKRQLIEVLGNAEGTHPLGDGLPLLRASALLPPQSADVTMLFDLLDQLNEAETHAVAQLRTDSLLQRAIRSQRAATRTLHEGLEYLRQYAEPWV